ncbi:hypothetical protein O9929_11405 [Vibrio lentus]|nr:hypothetical protein [Vibrio lentus]
MLTPSSAIRSDKEHRIAKTGGPWSLTLLILVASGALLARHRYFSAFEIRSAYR